MTGLPAKILTFVAGLVLAGTPLAAFGGSSAIGRATDRADEEVVSRTALANGCLVLAPVGGDRFVAPRDDGYEARRYSRERAAGFHLKPTGLGTYMLHDRGRRLLAAEGTDRVRRADAPLGPAEWRLRRRAKRAFEIESTANGRVVAAEPGTHRLILVSRDDEAARSGATRFRFFAARDCARFPEARVGASGRPFRGTGRDGSVFGFFDAHLHIAADLRAGGKVISGEPFHRFGIGEALGHDEDNHGPDGSLDVTGNLLRDGNPAGTHDTHGWPTFTGWPVHDTYTHQQTYYVWLKRAWKAGLRLVVAQAVEDEALCDLQPTKSHSCDEMETVKLAIRRFRALQDYVNAQRGGRGKGWFRIVTSPGQARRVIERGKLAVALGMETSSPLGCSEFQQEPQCTREDIDRELDELHRLGIRSLFVTHWVDNAFGGVALQGGAQGEFIGVFQQMTTGHPFSTEPCGEADEADGECNSKGLLDHGRYLVEQMMERGMLIETDHLSQKARAEVLSIAERHNYPLISSHTGTGGEWTPEQLERLYRLGGLASATADTAPDLVKKILRFRRSRSDKHYFGVGHGTDTGGFNALPEPRDDAESDPLPYPFRSHDGKVRFTRQRTGERTFDLNADGVAHYGLFADLIADMETQKGGGRALRQLFRSAEAYLRMWERAEKRSAR